MLVLLDILVGRIQTKLLSSNLSRCQACRTDETKAATEPKRNDHVAFYININGQGRHLSWAIFCRLVG